MKTSTPKLDQLYAEQSKHAHYQQLAPSVASLLGKTYGTRNTRYEPERWDFIEKTIDISGKRIADIGANTGYFSFRCMEAGASDVGVYEGNPAHCRFIEEAARALRLSHKMSVTHGHVDLSVPGTLPPCDVCFLLNVLHHFGDDYGLPFASADAAKSHIAASLRALSKSCRILIFQLGFNQMGDVSKPLFPGGTKREMIEFVSDQTRGSWDCLEVGVAERVDSAVHFGSLNNRNIERVDSLGEFLNRPLFVLRSLARLN
jgi:hypothetical protein